MRYSEALKKERERNKLFGISRFPSIAGARSEALAGTRYKLFEDDKPVGTTRSYIKAIRWVTRIEGYIDVKQLPQAKVS